MVVKNYIDTKIEELDVRLLTLEKTIVELKEINALLGKHITDIRDQTKKIITEVDILKEGGNL